MKQAMQKAWEAYRSNNPCQSEYMQTDYRNGYEDGWKGHEKQSKEHLYEMACTAAMNALIQTHPDGSPEYIAERAEVMARALVKRYYGDDK